MKSHRSSQYGKIYRQNARVKARTPLFLVPGKLAISIALVASIAISGCAPIVSRSAEDALASQGGCIPEGAFDQNKDYFPHKASFEYAKGVTVEYHKSYKVVTVKNPSARSSTPASYVLVQCGAPAPNLAGELSRATKITIPAKRIALGVSTTPVKFSALGKVDSIVGITNPQSIWDKDVQARYESGAIQNFAKNPGSSDVNTERLVALRPDLFIIGGQDDPSKFAKLQELKVPVVAGGDHMEATPLGRAEWIKYDSLFVNAESAATKTFTGIADSYNRMAEKAANVAHRPSVLYAFQSKGVWYAKSNENYSIKFLRDAGGEYVFKDVHGVASAKLDTEQVLAKALAADFWIDGGIHGHFSTVAEAVQTDSRLGSLAAVKHGNLWNATAQIHPVGKGNNYFQLGSLRPDLVLGDLVAILHPELLPDHKFTFYKKAPLR